MPQGSTNKTAFTHSAFVKTVYLLVKPRLPETGPLFVSLVTGRKWARDVRHFGNAHLCVQEHVSGWHVLLYKIIEQREGKNKQ